MTDNNLQRLCSSIKQSKRKSVAEKVLSHPSAQYLSHEALTTAIDCGVEQSCLNELGPEVYSMMSQYLEDHANMQELEETSQEFDAMQRFRHLRLMHELEKIDALDTPKK